MYNIYKYKSWMCLNMLKLFISITCLLFAMCLFANDGMGDHPKNNNKFANKLLREEIKQEKNFVISPMSLNMALSLVANGADGQTYNEFNNLLQNGTMNLKEMNIYNRNLLSMSKSLKVKNYNIANSLWIRGDYNKNFYLVAKNYYNADINPLKDANTINNWIKTKTNGKIPSMIDKVNPNDRALIVNAVYFYDNWLNKFPVYKTCEGMPFNKEDGKQIECTMMSDKGDYKVIDYKKGKVLIKRLKGDAAVYFMLPNKGVKLKDYLSSIDFNSLIVSYLEDGELYEISIPKFKMEYSKDYNDTFRSLGLKTAFDPSKANFSKLNKDYYISKILHKATIGIDEDGTEASAATVIQMAGMGAPVPCKEIIFDRPFGFAIVDEIDSVVIFEGAVYEPKLN